MMRQTKIAFDAAKEITVARVGSSNTSTTKDGGKDVAEFFEAIYEKLLEIAEKDGTD